MSDGNRKESDFIELKDSWRKAVATAVTITRGQACYRDKSISNCIYSKTSGKGILKAAVKSQSSRKKYKTIVTFNEKGEIIDHDCSCPAHREYDGMCKHCVAVVLYYLEFYQRKIAMASTSGDAEATPPKPASGAGRPGAAPSRYYAHYGQPASARTDMSGVGKTAVTVASARPPAPPSPVEEFLQERGQTQDEEMRKTLRFYYNATSPLIDAYRTAVLNEVDSVSQEEQAEGIAHLIPVLAEDDILNGATFSFYIRRNGSAAARPYLIKSIRELLESVRYEANVSYGKELSFVHKKAAFDDASQIWLALLGKHYSECSAYSRQYVYGSGDRSVRLSDAALCDAFERFVDEECPANADFWTETNRGKDVDKTPARFSKEPACLKVELRREDSGVVVLQCGQFQRLLDSGTPGRGYAYLFENRELRRFSLEASRTLFPLTDALTRYAGKLPFLPRQSADLFEHILPEVASYLNISDPQKLTDGRVASPMKGKILLDAPDKNTVTAIVIACYDGVWLNVATGRVVGRAEEGTTSLSSAVPVNWDAENVDLSGVRRNVHGEQRFLAAACQAMGVQRQQVTALLTAQDNELDDPSVRLSGSDAIFELLANGLQRLQSLGEVLVTNRMRKLNVEPPQRVSVGVSLDNDLLRLDIDAGDVAMDELRELLLAYHEKRRYFRLKNGGFVDLRQDKTNGETKAAFASIEELDQIEQGLQIDGEDFKEGAIRVPTFRALYLDGLFNESASLKCAKDEAFVRLTQRIRDFAHADFAEPEALRGVLRPYQRAGYRWLRCLEACAFGGILADDMGLGKSLQLIAVLMACDESPQKERLPSLIACPSSLVWNWRKEIEKFAPGLRVRIIQGTAAMRAARLGDVQPGEVVITSYDSLKRDAAAYEPLRFQYFVIDEAQFIKNHATQAAKAVKKIVCNQRFALTGTPIENRLSELWSIFDFLMPGYLYKYTRFREQFEIPITRDGDPTAKANLRGMILPFVLRRLKQEVLAELPPKITSVVPVELNEKQMEAYNAMLLTGLQSLKEKTEDTDSVGVQKMRVLALLTKLRRLCCDPSLCFDNYRHESSKLEVCMELLRQAREGNHRVLLFSQYTDMLDLLENRVRQEEMSFLRLQGSTPVKERMGLVDAFNQGNTDVFLISLKAGGTGLNLTAADTVIHYDPWWNLAAQDQATDRAYRIGQERKVHVYKLIAQNTIEEKILRLQEMKSDLAAIIEGDGEDALMRMTTDEIVGLLENR